MGKRRLPRRFSREWQRERSEQAQAETDATVEMVNRVRFGRFSFGYQYHQNWRVHGEDQVLPYRGFRAGRGRVRPDQTGYDDPASGHRSDEFFAVDLPVAPEVIGDVVARDDSTDQ